MAKYAFVHIPKTAGSAFWGALTSNCDLRASPHRLMVHYLAGGEEFQGDWDLYGGHTFYTLLKEVMPPDTKYMTILRHPVNRIYSHWQHLISKSVYDKYGITRKLSFSEFLRDKKVSGLVSNFQSRYLSYKPQMSLRDNALAMQIIAERASLGITDEQLRELTIKNIAEFAFVGRQEAFANAVMNACMIMGFPPPFDIEVVSVDYHDKISGEDINYIHEMNKVDLEIWSQWTK